MELPIARTTVSPAQQAPWGCECPLLIPKATCLSLIMLCVSWPQSGLGCLFGWKEDSHPERGWESVFWVVMGYVGLILSEAVVSKCPLSLIPRALSSQAHCPWHSPSACLLILESPGNTL